MLSPAQLEDAFQRFTNDLSSWTRDGGIIQVDLALLNRLGLLDQNEEIPADLQGQFPFYFHVIETPEKVTLFNQQFIVWIMPRVEEMSASTLVLISLMINGQPHLEIVFCTSGVYNAPKYVLKVLRYYLNEVMETEEEISSIEEETPPNGTDQ